jgi:hypothetical protein
MSLASRRASGRRLAPWFWGAFLVVILAGLLFILFAGIRGASQWAAQPAAPTDTPMPAWPTLVRITLLGGEDLYLEPEQLAQTLADTRGWLTQRRDQAGRRLDAELDPAFEGLIEATLARVPDYADWYYSLRGEYARLWEAAVGDLPAMMMEQLQARVFDAAGTAAGLERVGAGMDRLLETEVTAAGEQGLARLERLLRERARPVSGETGIEVAEAHRLDAQPFGRLDPYLELSGQDIARQGVAAGAGAAVGAAALKKLGASSAAKLGAKVAGSALAGAGSGAAAGAALCGASVIGAPLAAGCALVGGVVSGVGTWLLVDSAVLGAEEWLQREEFEQRLREDLRHELEALRDQLRSHYRDGLDTAFAQIDSAIGAALAPASASPTGVFVPARSGRPEQPGGY